MTCYVSDGRINVNGADESLAGHLVVWNLQITSQILILVDVYDKLIDKLSDKDCRNNYVNISR